MRVLRNNVLVEPFDIYQQHRPSGLVIPRQIDHPDPAPQLGRVLFCGPECSQVQPGEKVVWERHSGSLIHVHFDDPNLYVVNEEDLICSFTEE